MTNLTALEEFKQDTTLFASIEDSGASFIIVYLDLEFAALLPNWMAVYPAPSIYDLEELKGNYHCYIVLLVMPEDAQVLVVNIGAATTQAGINRSDSGNSVRFERLIRR